MSRETPLKRGYFDRQQCGEAGCKHTTHDKGLMISGSCHPGAPVLALVLNGILVFRCAVCDRHICDVAIASVPALGQT